MKVIGTRTYVPFSDQNQDKNNARYWPGKGCNMWIGILHSWGQM